MSEPTEKTIDIRRQRVFKGTPLKTSRPTSGGRFDTEVTIEVERNGYGLFEVFQRKRETCSNPHIPDSPDGHMRLQDASGLPQAVLWALEEEERLLRSGYRQKDTTAAREASDLSIVARQVGIDYQAPKVDLFSGEPKAPTSSAREQMANRGWGIVERFQP